MNILLEKIAVEQKYATYTLDIRKVSCGGSNISAAIFLIEIRAEGKPVLKLFAKTAALSEAARRTLPINCPFTTEIYVYSKVLKQYLQYQNIEDIHSIPKEHRVRMPKFYGSSDKYLNETLILENLVAEGFEDYDRNKPADLEYMSTAIQLMAKFHAISLAYHEDDPVGFSKFTEHLTMDMAKFEKEILPLRPKVLANAFKVAERKHTEMLKQYFAEDRPNSFRQLLDLYRCRKRNILIHGDFKPSNLMHRRRNGKLELIPMDFQLMRDGDPVLDLMYFIFTATDEEFRRHHYNAMLDEYYEQLSAALHRFHLDPKRVYSEKTYRKELKQCTMLGLVIGVVLLPMVLVDEDKAPAFDSDEADVCDCAVESSALYRERFNGILNNYVEWGLL